MSASKIVFSAAAAAADEDCDDDDDDDDDDIERSTSMSVKKAVILYSIAWPMLDSRVWCHR